MRKSRFNTRTVSMIPAAAGLMVVIAIPLFARERDSRTRPVEAKRPFHRHYGLDESGEELQKLVPLKPRTEEERKKIDSTAWFMAGQLRERRDDPKGALAAYQKAVELRPKDPEIYKVLVPLAFRLNQVELGVKYGLQAAKFDSEQAHQWYRQLSAQLVALRRISQAVEFLEKAQQSESLKKDSLDYVMVHRDLALLHGVMDNKEKAADAFEVLFDALVNQEKYNLDDRRRRRLERDPLTNYERIGNAFLEAERIELAVKAYEKAEKAGQGEPGSLGYNLAQVYHQTKQHEKALAQLQKYLDAQLQTKGEMAYSLLADILKDLNKSDELIERLETLAAKDSRNSTLQFFLAEQYLKKDRLEDAEKLFQKGLASGDSKGYSGLAAVYRRQNRPKELLEAMANAVKGSRDSAQLERNLDRLEPEMAEIGKNEKLLADLFTLGREYAQSKPPTLEFPTSLILAKLAANNEKIDDALEFYRYALELAGKHAATVYEEFGQYLVDAERYTDAVTLYKEAVDDSEVEQGKPHYLYRLSQAYELKGDTQNALKILGEARTLLSGRGMSQVPLLDYHEAWIHYHSKQWEQAIESFEKYIATYPQQREMVHRCRSILSSIYVQKGDMKKGEEILEQMLQEDPEDPTVNNDLGYLYADQGKNLEQAEKMIRKAVEAQPENAAYLDSMGWVLFKLNRFEEALPHLEKAASKPSGEDATIFDHLGDCYEKLNRPEKAVESWKKAIEFEKKSPKPDQKVLEKIEQKLKKDSGQ